MLSQNEYQQERRDRAARHLQSVSKRYPDAVQVRTYTKVDPTDPFAEKRITEVKYATGDWVRV